MRQLRWKTKYRTGNTVLDDRKKALVDSLNEFVDARRIRWSTARI